MANPTSAIHICNLALDRLGQREIASLDTPTTDIEETCARNYDATRRELLRRFIFNFAKKYAVLSVSVTKTPAFGYTYAYALPNDFMRLLALGDVSIDADISSDFYDLSEGYIFTDENSSDSINIQYVFDAKVIANYDPLFVRLFVLSLANSMAYKFTLKNSVMQGIRDELQDVQLAAAAVSGQEKPPRRIERSRLLDARRFGNQRRSGRYYPD